MEGSDFAPECRRRLEALELNISDPRLTQEALEWGLQMLLGLQTGRKDYAPSKAESIGTGLEAQNAPSVEVGVGEKRRALEPLENVRSKAPRLMLDSAVALSLEVVLKMAESAELGEWMAQRVVSNMNSQYCNSLITLIEHCLLLSLDQGSYGEIMEDAAGKDPEDGGKPGYWLHGWLIKQVLYQQSCLEDQNLIRFPLLDWLLAYFTATKPELFIEMLLDEIASHQSEHPPSLVPYLRQAAIFEFAALRSPELVAPAIALLLQSAVAEGDKSKVQDKLYTWTVQSALCPRFMSTVGTALTPMLEVSELLWERSVVAQVGQVTLPASWTNGLNYALDTSSDLKAWSSMLIIRHFEALAAIASDLVLFLCEVSPSLLDWVNRTLSFIMMSQLTGKRVDTKSLFLENLQKNLLRLCNAASSRSSMACRCCALEQQTGESKECRKCGSKNHLLHTCQIILLASPDGAVAELLAQETLLHADEGLQFNTPRLQTVVKFLQIVCGTGRDKVILALWTQKIIDYLHVSDCNQALGRILAVRQLSDAIFSDVQVAGKPIWRNVCNALSQHWLEFLSLLHREVNHKLSLNVLGLLQLLISETSLTSEMATLRLKAALGLYFHHLRMENTNDANNVKCRWDGERENALLRKIIVQLGAFSTVSFTSFITMLFDFSFEAALTPQHGVHAISEFSKSDTLMVKPVCQTIVSLAASRLTRYGKMDLLCPTASGDCKGGVVDGLRVKTTSKPDARNFKKSSGTFTAICALAVHCFRKSLAAFQAKLETWTRHPAEVLVMLLVDRLETPHELSLTMEQYEEILPKHVSAIRHTFLVECFRQNPLLFKVLELVMEHGYAKELRICAEFVRALLAESISQWHGALRNQQLNSKSELDRLQVLNVIQLVTSAQWLPQPLASCGEIISLVSNEDIATLLFIIWRCMHAELSSGDKSSETDVANQAKAEESKGTGSEWEVQFLSILRHNISRIGAHFARLYPQQRLVNETLSGTSQC